MRYSLGLDLGTSSLRCLLLSQTGSVVAVASAEYSILVPSAGWAEQDPLDWWKAACHAVQEVLHVSGVNPADIVGVGLSGQMHGTVMLDEDNQIVAPAIIWSDGRSGDQCETFRNGFGEEHLYQLTGMPVATGFMGPSLLWVKENQPDLFRRVHTVCLPKDYLRLRLAGVVCSEPSDGSGTLLLETAKKDWSAEILRELGIPINIMPELRASDAIVGEVTATAAADTGLAPGTPVIAGGSDQAMSAIGSGLLHPGIASAAIGTGGQLITPVAQPIIDRQRRLHSLCHALPDQWLLMGAMLSAGLCMRWFRDQFGVQEEYKDFSRLAESVPPGAEGLIFLPYLTGERTPHMDHQARALFFGLTLKHTKGHMLRAIMEGVVFGMNQSLEIFSELGVHVDTLLLSGGGAKSSLWRQIQADIYQREVHHLTADEHSSLGAAMLAGSAVGVWPDLPAVSQRVVERKEPVSPNPENQPVYQRRYNLFKTIYPRVKDLFAELE